MVKLHKLHKFFGLTGGVLILLLSLSGFFLNHKKWSFLYTTSFTTLPQTTLDADKRLFEAYYVDTKNKKHIVVGSRRGLFESFDAGENFSKISSLQILSIKSDEKNIYLATSEGIYKLDASKISLFALHGEYISSLSVKDEKLVAIVEKSQLILLDAQSKKELYRGSVFIEKEKLQEDISLSRFIRDLHYGRGLFDGDISLFINDYGTLFISFLAISGYMIWYMIKKRRAKSSRKLIRMHANVFAIFATLPLVILAITGIFLDHSEGLAKFMRSTLISHSFLPPVYNSLQADIWSVDFDGENYRIGNRYGVYKSENLRDWSLENRGFAYKMIRKNKNLYVSGMGASNRLYDGAWSILKSTPHMFRDVIEVAGVPYYFSTTKSILKLPHFNDATLYTLLLTLHDGSFFASWWVWVNDYIAVTLLLLSITGTLRWYAKLSLRNIV